jgi:YfiH family protein
MDFELRKKGNLQYLVIPVFEKTELVRHGFSTRLGGLSPEPYDSLNLGFKKSDDNQRVLKNHELLCDALNVDIKNLVASDQVHGDEVLEVTEQDRGKGIILPSDIVGKDALITNKKNVALITYYADCVPLFFLDIKTPAIGLAHSGWRGTVKKIGRKTVEAMKKNYGSRPEFILAAIGPCIKKCCYEVDEPVIREFKKAYSNWHELAISNDKGRWMLDLTKANIVQLTEAGIKYENIFYDTYCTSCRRDLFFSHRADHGRTGSLAAIMELV